MVKSAYYSDVSFSTWFETLVWGLRRRYTSFQGLYNLGESMKPSLSVVVITHNEESNILRCLKSVRARKFSALKLQEILVVDSQSTDDTVRQARRLGARVVVRPWPGYAAQKNWALDRVRGDWVLSLDADEEMTIELWDEIERTLPSTAEQTKGYRIQRRAFFLGRWMRHCGWWPDAQLRLFRRGTGRFTNHLVHEGLEVVGQVSDLTAPMNHHSYATIGQYLEKMDRYSALSAASAPERKKRLWHFYLVMDPFTTFLRMYVAKMGFLDGWHGFVLCGLSSLHSFVKYARLWEREVLHRDP
jgi:glycosyltransferase involved in cell wall biosynthesis